jgi:ATP-dependent Lon protease
LDSSAAEKIMSAELLTTLQVGPDADPTKAPGAISGMAEQIRMPEIPGVLSILPVRGFVVFPGTVAPLNVRRPASIKLLDETLPESKIIGLVTQRDENKEDPAPQDLYEVGTAAIVLKLLRQSDDHVIALVQGLRRFALRKITQTSPFVRAEVALLDSIQPPPTKEWEAAFRNLRDSAAQLLDLTSEAPDQASVLVRSIENPEQLVDFLAPNLNVDVAQKQAILEELNVETRLRAVQTHISSQLEIAQIQQKLQKDVQSHFSDAQRKAYLREQLKAIQRELGEGDTGTDEQVAQLRARLEEAKPPADVMAQADRELKRLDFIPPASPEYSVIVSYVEIIADLPWSKLSEDNLDLDQAQQILDRDH